jgi:hypothetical protein
MNLFDYLNDKKRSLFEEGEIDPETGKTITPPDDIDLLKKRAAQQEKLNKIAKEEASNVGEDVDEFSIETQIGDLSSSKEANKEDAETINKMVKDEIESAIKSLKDSENESCDVKISYMFKGNTTELRAYFSFDKDGNITEDDINVPPLKKVKTIKEFLASWKKYSWRNLE